MGTTTHEKANILPATEAEERECPLGICDGSGLIEKAEFVCGDNIVPGGYYEGTGEFTRCECARDCTHSYD